MEVIVLDMFHVNVADVCGVQLLTNQRALVKFSSPAVYKDLVARYDGCLFYLPADGGTVTVSDPCCTLTYVALHGVPFKFSEGLL